VGVLGAADGVELFLTFNDAMEWTENAYLRAWFKSQKVEFYPISLALASQRVLSNEYNPTSASSPRRSHLCDVGDRTIATEIFSQDEPGRSSEPMNTLIKAFSSYGNLDSDLFRPISSYFERLSVPSGHVLWNQYDLSDGLYVIESGVLRASYEFPNPAQHFEESMVAGTLAGELSALSDSTRNATVIVEQAAVLWKLSIENIRRLQMDEPELARTFIRLVLKAAKIDYDILLGAIASRH
jgi:SulP family sulfate permease